MEQNEKTKMTSGALPEKVNTRKNGGLYSKVTMSVRSANILILIGLVLLVGVTLFLIRHGGFTVRFDTDGGSRVESQKVMHSEYITEPQPPVKEGWHFTGWFLDRDCTVPWNPQTDPVTQSMTLYAGWEPVDPVS